LYILSVDPAEAIAESNRQAADTTPAPAAAAWLAHPADNRSQPLTQAQQFALELGIDDLDNYRTPEANHGV
jgi:hypothetical protein